ncbi:MAG: IS6 family transposase [Acidobacteriota bacterium]|nr:IS6 family transposase [Acidobacteriota bacterium]
MMATSRSTRDPLFLGRWFEDEVIIVAVRWYLTYPLSYGQICELLQDRGVSVAPSTVMRWVLRYAPEFEKRWRPYEKPVGLSWRVDETYIKVAGEWTYLYRAVDSDGRTVDFFLSKRRDVHAAKTLFRHALRKHGDPLSVTLDAYAASHRAVQELKDSGEIFYQKMRVRSCAYLNNIARVVISGIEFAEKIKKTRVPGVAVAVVYNDQVVFLRGYGVRTIPGMSAYSRHVWLCRLFSAVSSLACSPPSGSL